MTFPFLKSCFRSAPLLFGALLLPAAAAADLSATDFGAVGDGATLNTPMLQRAIDECSARGGGALVLPPGRYVTGTLQIKDGVTLRLAREASLLGSTNAADYRNLDPFTDGTGSPLGYALITAVDATRVGIEGAGVIDGRGALLKAAQSNYTIRPFLVRWVRCQNVTVRDVQLRNSGAWTMHFFQTTNAVAEGLTIRSRGLSNNDGIDIDSSENVRVRGCDIDTGDDSICLKATSASGCRDITVTGCQLTSSCAAIKFGTESLGDFERVRISDCQIRNTRLGGIKLFSVDGAHLRDVVISDITMDDVTVPVMMRLGARLRTFRPGDVKKPPGALRDVTIRNVRATNARQIGMLISGVPGHSIEAVTFENIDLQMVGGESKHEAVSLRENEGAYPEIRMFGPVMPAHGLYARHVNGVTFRNVRTTVANPDARPAVEFVDVRNVTPADFGSAASGETEKRKPN